ncbi:MAG: hypothetical protein L0226_13745 [Acidobacteria bacterium]|nr:hypothetical protein [Acidobacteriota bacterium]
MSNALRNNERLRLILHAPAIAALLVLCSLNAPSQDKQAQDKKREERRGVVNLLIAHIQQQNAILGDLLDTDAKCMREIEAGEDLRRNCDIFDKKLKLTSVEVLMPYWELSEAIDKLPADELEALKHAAFAKLRVAYERGKQSK